MPSFSKECLGGFVGFQRLAIDPNIFLCLQIFGERAALLRQATRSGVGARIPHDL
jgi:hypothetical protein